MTPTVPGSQTKLYALSIAILIAGLISAVAVYLTAHERNDGEYQVVGNFVYPNATESSKRYVHDLELYGGKAAVMADKLTRWFNGLWQGESLAFTIGWISAFVSLCVFLAARHPAMTQSDAGKEPDKTG